MFSKTTLSFVPYPPKAYALFPGLRTRCTFSSFLRTSSEAYAFQTDGQQIFTLSSSLSTYQSLLEVREYLFGYVFSHKNWASRLFINVVLSIVNVIFNTSCNYYTQNKNCKCLCLNALRLTPRLMSDKMPHIRKIYTSLARGTYIHCNIYKQQQTKVTW